jgi:hypothetical protein
MGRVPDTSHADEFTLHPEGGPYGFIVSDVEEKERESDREMVAWVKLESDVPGQGNVLCQFTLNDRFLFLLRRFLDAIDMPAEGGYDWEDLKGKRVKAYIIHKEHKGKTYANVSEWAPYNTPTTPNTVNGEDIPF